MDYQKEMQKSFKDILQITHRRIYNTLLNYTNGKNIKSELVDVLNFVFDEMRVIEKDIKISESDAGNTNSL